MQVTGIKTHKITEKDTDIFKILDQYLPEKLPENSVVAITSKIVSITEGRMVKMEGADKDELIKRESQYYLARETNPYHIALTVTNNTLIASAGIDESNANGYYVLWPVNARGSANKIRLHLKKKFGLTNVGVIVTDSKTTPLRWGVTAISIGYSGIEPLIDYIGTEDLFGRKFAAEKMSVIDNFACTAAVVMGEGREQTPIAIITEIPFAKFTDKASSEDDLKISMQDDLYGPILKNAPWEKGGK